MRIHLNRRLALMFLLVAGCGPQIPDEFTVSGQPLEHWLEALGDQQTSVRLRAVRALGNVGPEVPEVVEALSAALSDPEPEVRLQVAQSLLKFGPGAREAIPALTAARADSDEQVRSLVEKALERIEVN
jgi:HEAT repeat protein